MIINIIGIRGTEKLEKKLDPAKFQVMAGALDTLKAYRDKEAHEYIKGTTRSIAAPSIIINLFHDIYNGLVNIDEKLYKI